MDKKFIMKKAEFMRRILQIVYLNYEKKIGEVMLQGNRCPECKGINIQYPVNSPKSNIHTSGDSPNYFTSNALVCWTATCLDCGKEIPIHSSFDFDIEKGFEVYSGDFFLDKNGNYGHSLRK